MSVPQLSSRSTENNQPFDSKQLNLWRINCEDFALQ
jgi:hypothetical protein